MAINVLVESVLTTTTAGGPRSTTVLALTETVYNVNISSPAIIVFNPETVIVSMASVLPFSW